MALPSRGLNIGTGLPGYTAGGGGGAISTIDPRQQPQIPYYLGALRGLSPGGGFGIGSGSPEDLLRRKRRDAANAAPLPRYSEPTLNQRPSFNPYYGLFGFGNYSVTAPGDALSRWRTDMRKMNLPSRERVGQIASADQALRGRSVTAPPAGPGYGVGTGGYDDLLKRLLRDRLYGEGY